MSTPSALRMRNQLLARLQSQSYERLRSHLKTVTLQHGQVLYEAHSPIEAIYFPHNCLALLLAVRRSGVPEPLHVLQEQGLISGGRGVIEVRTRQGLEAASRDCYGIVVKEYARLLGTE